MDRVERIRSVVDDIIRKQPDIDLSRCGFVHLYGVALTAGILAARRGLDIGVCTTAGMLHDIHSYRMGYSPDHAIKGAVEAYSILADDGGYTPEEMDTITTAIGNHSDKGSVHDAYSELLKDADVLQHYFYNVSMVESERGRLLRVMRELGISSDQEVKVVRR